MKIQLIADSCCDVTPAMRATLGLQTAALTITIDGDKHYKDTPALNMKKLLAEMKASKKATSTAAPSLEEYANLMRMGDAAMVVTLSSQLSGSYNAACAARDLVLEEEPNRKIAVFDSKSAASAELRIVLYIHQLISEGLSFDEIEEKTREFISNLNTLFILEDLSNLAKNGRLPKMTALLGSMLMVRPIMYANKDGEIEALDKIRGTAKAIDRLIYLIGERVQNKPAGSVTLCLSYCNCPERAADMKKRLLAQHPAIGDVLLAPTAGIATVYANDGGVICAFE